MNNSAARPSWRNGMPGAILLVLVGLIGGASLTAWRSPPGSARHLPP